MSRGGPRGRPDAGDDTDAAAGGASRPDAAAPGASGSLAELLDRLDVPMADRAGAGLRPLVGLRVEEMAGLGPRTMTGPGLAERVGRDHEVLRRWWRVMGFPEVDDRVRAFTETDAEMIEMLGGVLDREIVDVADAEQVMRVTAAALQRVAEVQGEALTTRLEELAGPTPTEAQIVQFVEAARAHVLPVYERMVDYMWRRQLAAVLRRQISLVTGDGERTGERAVGFVDLVGFTRLGKARDDRELARLLDRFERLALEVITDHGARLVKSIGDEVMVVASSPEAGVAVGLGIVEACAEDAELPDAHAGFTWGPVVETLGDVYGVSVNLASRLVGAARPASLVVDQRLAERVDGMEGLRASPFKWKGPSVGGVDDVRPQRVRRIEQG